jgi:hypothetical protein
MGVNTNFGAKLWISSATTTTATDTQAEFEALSYTQVGKIVSMGQFGDTYQDVPFTPLENARTEHLKGTVDGGTMQLEVGFDASDTGQDALMTALADVNGLYAFQVQLGDGSSGSPSAPTTQYFLGRVMAAPLNIGSANTVPTRSVTISVNTAIIQVDAV